MQAITPPLVLPLPTVTAPRTLPSTAAPSLSAPARAHHRSEAAGSPCPPPSLSPEMKRAGAGCGGGGVGGNAGSRARLRPGGGWAGEQKAWRVAGAHRSANASQHPQPASAHRSDAPGPARPDPQRRATLGRGGAASSGPATRRVGRRSKREQGARTRSRRACARAGTGQLPGPREGRDSPAPGKRSPAASLPRTSRSPSASGPPAAPAAPRTPPARTP